MRGKEYLCALRPCGDGLLLETLHYADEIKEAEPLFSSVEDETSDDELLSVATELIGRKTSDFDAAAYEDRYDKALRELIDKKRSNKKTPRAKTGGDEAPSGENVVDLMSALKESLKDDKKGGAKKSGGRSRSSGSSKSSSSGSSSGGRRKTG
jgi:DNA end-binding protein Ku